jgi:arylsulfatase A
VPRFQLFNLAKDPAEKTNVIDKHPELAERLKAQLAKVIENGRTRP